MTHAADKKLKSACKDIRCFSTSKQILLGSRDDGIKTSGTLESKIELHSVHPFVCKSFESTKIIYLRLQTNFSDFCANSLLNDSIAIFFFFFLKKVPPCFRVEGNRTEVLYVFGNLTIYDLFFLNFFVIIQ